MKEKQSIDYYRNNRFCFRIGKVSYRKAHCPISQHTHENCIELVFMMKGCQTYQVEQEFYTIYGGEVFIAFQGEKHSTGEKPEEKAEFYYLILDLYQLLENEEFCVEVEKDRIYKLYEKRDNRIRKSNTWYCESCRKLWDLCCGAESFKHTKIRNILSLLLIDFAEREAITRKTGWEIDQALAYIKQNIKEDIHVKDIAENMHISVSRFKTVFMDMVGIPPREYVIREKLKCCKQELSESRKSITEIAHEYGFSSSQYFSTVFKKYCTVTPAVYRKGGRENDES